MKRILLVITAAALVATTMLTTGAADPAFAQDEEPVCTIGEQRLMTEAETERYPEGHWIRSQGQWLSINSYRALFSVIGTTYGGNGQYTFWLPNRLDPDPNPNGEHWYICAQGIMPPRGSEPITKDQCKNGGYATLGFRNQGDCTSFVATEGKNEPGKNQKTK